MSKNTKQRFKRQIGQRRYKKMFILSTEGTRTEPSYFRIFNNNKSIVCVKCLKRNDNSSPKSVLKRMKKYLSEEAIRSNDEAWLVIDRDQWTGSQLDELFKWSEEKDNYGFAVSNPNFEFWLLLHFEAGTQVSSNQCLNRLRQYIPGFDKQLDIRIISVEMVQQAIKRAKELDNPPCEDWPRSSTSTVYKLVEKLIN